MSFVSHSPLSLTKPFSLSQRTGLLVVGATVLFLMSCSGGEPPPTPSEPEGTSTQQASDEQSERVDSGHAFDARPVEVALKSVTISVRTNIPGATLVAVDGDEEVAQFVLEGNTLEHGFELSADKEYTFRAQLAGLSVEGTHQDDTSRSVPLMFDRDDVKEICQQAVCLIRIPNEGHGSGFLLGARDLVATAAHVVGTPELDQLQFVFNPDDEEEVIQGGRLIYFDAQQDVALLRLSQPVKSVRPYLWPETLQRTGTRENLSSTNRERTNESSQTGNAFSVFIIGNPGRGDDYDPLYLRPAKIVRMRPDEFELNIELKPGYSGGPVCSADTGHVVGLVSYKIAAGRRYQDVGRSFAKSVAIASDARDRWLKLSERGQEKRIERTENRFKRKYGYQRARLAAANLLIDGSVYTLVCKIVTQAYRIHMFEARRRIPPTARKLFVKRQLQRAHKEFINKILPEVAKDVQEKITPKLQPDTDRWYNKAIQHDNLSESVREDLQKAHDAYEQLKTAAEQLAAGKGEKGKSADEFDELIEDWWSDLQLAALQVIETCNAQLAE